VPKLSGGAQAKPQTVQLEEWAASLRPGQIVVFAADDADVGMEGDYWLARLRSATFPCPATMVHASDQLEEGFLVVQAQW